MWEVMARKPGNVHPQASFVDSHAVDFLLSAAAIAPVLDEVQSRGVGPSILEAVLRTRQVTRSNTNLGILLLLVPLAAVPQGTSLREGVISVLDGLTVQDSVAVFHAIRIANPGGLGQVPEQDIAELPTLPLRPLMSLAADRDLIAQQYRNGFLDIFTLGCNSLREALRLQWPLEEAILYCQLKLMSVLGDTLISRKRNRQEAKESAARANAVLACGWPEHMLGWKMLQEFDTWLRAEGHQRNPGATADLVSACLFTDLREGNIPIPLTVPWASSRWPSGCSAIT